MKKALSILLAVLMLASCLAACAPAEPDETQGNTPQPSATTPGGTGPTAQGPEVPALKGPGNIVIKSVYQNVAFDPNADISAQLIEEVTGYKAEYIMLPAENANEKLAMDAASGADYDIIRCSVDQFNMLLSSGALMPLNDLLEVYGPDIIAGYTQETWDAVSDSNGTIYGIPYKYASDQEVASFLTCRWDLMQAAGIEKLPQTLDEFYDCLVTLKNYYGDEYIILTGPFLPTTEKNENWRFPKSIASAFGIWNEWMVDEKGEVIYMTEAEGFEDTLETSEMQLSFLPNVLLCGRRFCRKVGANKMHETSEIPCFQSRSAEFVQMFLILSTKFAIISPSSGKSQPTIKNTYGVDEVRRNAAFAFLVCSKTQKVTQ